jgi:hypothetical protein
LEFKGVKFSRDIDSIRREWISNINGNDQGLGIDSSPFLFQFYSGYLFLVSIKPACDGNPQERV